MSSSPLFIDDRRALESGLPFNLFERITDHLFFAADDAAVTLGQLQWLREAKTACMFGRTCGADWVRLNADDSQTFDCEIKLKRGPHFRFQVTEILAIDRRRTAEYRRWNELGRPSVFSEGDFSSNRDAIVPALEAIVKKKSKIEYPLGTSLLLYFNIPTYGCWDDFVEEQCKSIASRAGSRFSSVWIIWGSRLLRCWPDPFKRSDYGLRPGRHDLGSAIRAYENKQLLNDLFATDRVTR